MDGPLIGGWINELKSNGKYPCSKCVRYFRIAVMVTAVSAEETRHFGGVLLDKSSSQSNC